MLIYFQSYCIVALEIFCCKIFFETFCEVRYKEKRIRNYFEASSECVVA